MRNFKIQELVPKKVYEDRGEKAIQLLDKSLILFIDNLRSHLGKPITINNWLWGGDLQYRGLRTPDSDVYSKYSQHSYGRAVDFDVKGMSAEEVRHFLVQHRYFHWIEPVTFIEDDVSWVHVDVRTGTNGELWLWSPETAQTKVIKR